MKIGILMVMVVVMVIVVVVVIFYHNLRFLRSKFYSFQSRTQLWPLERSVGFPL